VRLFPFLGFSLIVAKGVQRRRGDRFEASAFARTRSRACADQLSPCSSPPFARQMASEQKTVRCNARRVRTTAVRGC